MQISTRTVRTVSGELELQRYVGLRFFGLGYWKPMSYHDTAVRKLEKQMLAQSKALEATAEKLYKAKSELLGVENDIKNDWGESPNVSKEDEVNLGLWKYFKSFFVQKLHDKVSKGWQPFYDVAKKKGGWSSIDSGKQLVASTASVSVGTQHHPSRPQSNNQRKKQGGGNNQQK